MQRDPDTFEKYPTGHGGQVASPEAVAFVPGGHGEHAEGSLEPLFGLNVPIGHTKHTASDGALYVPAGQLRHAAEEFEP